MQDSSLTWSLAHPMCQFGTNVLSLAAENEVEEKYRKAALEVDILKEHLGKSLISFLGTFVLLHRGPITGGGSGGGEFSLFRGETTAGSHCVSHYPLTLSRGTCFPSNEPSAVLSQLHQCQSEVTPEGQ